MSTIKCACHHCGAALIRKSAPSIKSKLHFCDNNCKGEYQRTLKPVSEGWLREHYIGKGLDTTKIAHMVNRDPKSVWNWLKDFGIPTRPRGGRTLPHCWKKGQPNAFQGKHHSEETKKRLSEIAKRDGRVPFDPKVGSYMKGRRGADTPGWKGGCTPERQSVYASEEWADAVKKVWKRDNATCRRCGEHHNQEKVRGTFHIHHVISFAVKATRCDQNNLILLCKTCHRWIHGKKNTEKQFISGRK